MIRQKTIKQNIIITGLGLHSGRKVEMMLSPAEKNSGIRFQRIDLPGRPEVKADIQYAQGLPRHTEVKQGDAVATTLEHLMAALYQCGVTNLHIEIDSDELPILDGSAARWMDEILKTDLVEQDAEAEQFIFREVLRFADPEKGSTYLVIPDSHFSIEVNIDYHSEVMPPQFSAWSEEEDFRREIAPARTFCFLHELQWMKNNGLAKGGSLENALVFIEKIPPRDVLQKLSEEYNVSLDHVQPGRVVLNDEPLRYPNEAARHKLLDVMGDLALLQTRLQAKIIAHKPGHSSNIAFARFLREYIKKRKALSAPYIDWSQPPAKDIHGIQAMLPHAYPFLLIDKIMKLSDREVIGVKNVTINEPFFQGHFPGAPVMPGVLQIEAMAQAGGILLLSTVPDPENYLTFFMKIDQVKFRNKVIPGDVLVFHLELLSPIRRGICEMKGIAYIGDKIASEGVLTAQIAKKS